MADLKLFIVYFKYKNPGDKKPGPVRPYRIYASGPEEARRAAVRYANYPNVEIVDVRAA